MLQSGRGAPAPPHPQARLPSHGRSRWFSQTQRQLSHRAQNRIGQAAPRSGNGRCTGRRAPCRSRNPSSRAGASPAFRGEPPAKLAGDLLRYVAGPALRCVEGDHAHRVGILSLEEIADHGLAVGPVLIDLAPVAPALAEIVQHDIHVDIIGQGRRDRGQATYDASSEYSHGAGYCEIDRGRQRGGFWSPLLPHFDFGTGHPIPTHALMSGFPPKASMMSCPSHAPPLTASSSSRPSSSSTNSCLSMFVS